MAKLVLALALGAQALLAPSNKLPVNTVRRAASTAPEMVVKVGVIGAGRIGLVHLEALRAAVSFLTRTGVLARRGRRRASGRAGLVERRETRGTERDAFDPHAERAREKDRHNNAGPRPRTPSASSSRTRPSRRPRPPRSSTSCRSGPRTVMM